MRERGSSASARERKVAVLSCFVHVLKSVRETRNNMASGPSLEHHERSGMLLMYSQYVPEAPSTKICSPRGAGGRRRRSQALTR